MAVGDGGDVEEEVARASKRRMQQHGILQSLRRQKYPAYPLSAQSHANAERSAKLNHKASPEGQSAPCVAHPQDSATTCEGSRAQKSRQPPRRATSLATHLSGIVKADELMGITCADGLHHACILSALGRQGQRQPPGTMMAGKSFTPASSQHGGRQALVTGSNTHHPLALR
ncbi:MAG: hypothetical protein R2880_20860 [Deinococcales bacterium]